MLIFLLMALQVEAAGKKYVPIPVPPPAHEAKCVEPEKKLLMIGAKSSGSILPGGKDHEYAKEAQCYANAVYASGCIERKVMQYGFKTLERDDVPAFLKTDNAKAWELFTKNAPYALDLRWYYSRRGVIGYTFYDRDNFEDAESETRIWTNTRMGLSAKSYGAHQVHETSHQRRAGAFGHWTKHEGSFPYVVGDATEECIAEQFRK